MDAREGMKAACKHGQLEVVECLLAKGVEAKQGIYEACYHRQDKVVECLLGVRRSH